MIRDSRAALRYLTCALGIAIAGNYAWELAQAPLYEMSAVRRPFVHCFVASLGDGVMFLVLLAVVSAVRRSMTWVQAPRRSDYGFIVLSAFLIALVVEWAGLAVGRWRYGHLMPLVPGTEVGLVPILQMMVLSPVTMYIAATVGCRTR
jgi:hypothetical protein